jgi:hypothetical protein
MDRKAVLQIIEDMLINRKIAEYSNKLIECNPKGEYFKDLANNIRVMIELQQYLKENLK